MKYLKVFESYKVDKREYPEDGDALSLREKEILSDLSRIPDVLTQAEMQSISKEDKDENYYLKFNIKKDDGYYYTQYLKYYYNIFANFSDLKDYIKFRYFIRKNDTNGFLQLFKTSKLDMSFDDNVSIQWASENAHKEIVKLLLKDPRVDPSAQDNYAIRVSSEKGHKKVVKLLLEDPRVDPSDDNNYAIDMASYNSHKEIVKLLLQDPRVDPSVSKNSVIRWASYKGHKEIVKLLLNDPRVRAKLTSEEINKYRNETY